MKRRFHGRLASSDYEETKLQRGPGWAHFQEKSLLSREFHSHLGPFHSSSFESSYFLPRKNLSGQSGLAAEIQGLSSFLPFSKEMTEFLLSHTNKEEKFLPLRG